MQLFLDEREIKHDEILVFQQGIKQKQNTIEHLSDQILVIQGHPSPPPHETNS